MYTNAEKRLVKFTNPTSLTIFIRVRSYSVFYPISKKKLNPKKHLLLAVGNVVLHAQRSVLGNVLHRATIRSDPALLAASNVVLAVKLGETPLVGLHDFLSPGELELSTAQGLNHMVSVDILGAHRHDDLANRNTGSHLHGLTVGVTHT